MAFQDSLKKIGYFEILQGACKTFKMFNIHLVTKKINQ